MDLSIERSYPTPIANSPLLQLLIVSLLSRQKPAPKEATRFHSEYDYVIVGGGSAGSVLASRLSEERSVSVLLLEAGGVPPKLTDVPSISRSFVNTDLDWQYKTVPQRHTAKALVNRQVPWPSGKGLGGSTLFNAMIYSRGNRKNYDDWAEQGAEGWSYEDVRPYFLKLENNTDPEFLRNGYHSSDGPVSVHKPKYESEMKKHLPKAVREIGYHIVDSNGPRQTGFYNFQATLRDSQRCNTAKAYLVPAENRTNLHIVTHAFVKKIVTEGTQVTGVQFDHHGSSHYVRAKKEVIMAAGAVNTPQILMLSGIGPREHLEELKIPVVADLPVGKNFHDHASVPLSFELKKTIPTTIERIRDSRNIQEYIDNRTGPLASAQFTAMIGYVNAESEDPKEESEAPKEDFPAAQIYVAELTTKLPEKQLGLIEEVYEATFKPYEGEPFYICGVFALQPKSRGTIRLHSADPYDPPLIDPNYFEHPDDVEATVKALKVAHKLATSHSMKKVGSKPFQTPFPGCEEVREDQDEFYECLARHLIVPMNHPVGTAKMGDPEDPTTVVDPELRVKGIEGLRIADASVMPIIPSGNVNIPTIMVAEKASDIIKLSMEVDGQKKEAENLIQNIFQQ